ncbi:hypothetical protein JW865_02610 [Candidatus Bathyarchaeota archaeon]|nr:hypothetical protein [Candidatus Bathyarchaeota archaeon]
MALLTINPIIGKSDLFEVYNSIQQYIKITAATSGIPTNFSMPTIVLKQKKLLWLFWQVIKWFLAFSLMVSSMRIPFIGPFMNIFYMIISGIGDWSLVPRIFLLAIQPVTSGELINLMPTMEVQYRLIFILILTVFGVISLRLILKSIKEFINAKYSTGMRNIFIIFSLITLAFIFDSPYWRMDITTPHYYYIALTLLFSFILISILLDRGVTPLQFTKLRRQNIIVTGSIIILIGIIAINAGIIALYNFNWNNNWVAYEWYPFTSKQIDATQWASGIDSIVTRPIEDYPVGNETKILSVVRQWDYESALTRMVNLIPVNWLKIITPDIVYVYGKEYWISPTTIKYPSEDWISHQLIYTHASNIFAIESHSGESVPITEALHLTKEPEIYYGEEISDTVYIKVKGFNEVENITYRGESDYTLSGWQRMMWFLAQGQLGFAFAPPQESIEMLYNRDIVNRAEKILIDGLKIDPDPYIVANNNTVYYAIQVYIQYKMNSRFVASDYYRFFAVILVNVEDGEMSCYTVGEDDGFLATFYKNYYSNWGSIPEWLVPQLRYPEALLGSVMFDIKGQLDIDFVYHVSDPYVWRSGSDFFERPPSTEVNYILLTEDNQVLFVGVQLAEYVSSAGKNLAGMYIIGSGTKLGEIQLLKVTSGNGTSSLIGPTGAVSAFQTNSEVREKLTLFGSNYKLGNVLLYRINQKLYYFIPVYITSGGGIISKMPFIGVVDALTRDVAIGIDSSVAFYSLTQQAPIVQPGEEERINDTYNIFTENGYTPINVTAINAEVFIQVSNITYINLQQKDTMENVVLNFIENKVKIYGPDVYKWISNENILNYGVFKTTQKGVNELHYISIKIK